MTWNTDFEALLTQTVDIAAWVSSDEYGKVTYGSATTYPARIVEKLEKVVDFAGREVLSNSVVWVGAETAGATLPSVNGDAKITMPDGTTPGILRVETYPDDTGNHHVKIYLDRALRN